MSKKRFTGLLIGALLSSAAQATTLYVSDIQFVSIREGVSNNTRAVERGLKSGTPLELIEQSNGYTKVRTPSGNEGWVADYFLSETRVSRDQLLRLENRLTTSAETNNTLTESLNESQQTIAELNEVKALLEQENSSLKQQLEEGYKITEQAQVIVAENESTSYQIESYKQQAEISTQQLQSAQDNSQQYWFLIGVGTLFSGLLLGVLLPSLKRKKKTSDTWF
ncbi:TIGR04211 family SH3 domain-containing protein [Marinomonas sp. C2222]|uniref:TIGR04211 family SH3 domain-containing protein n=1 Tax=Marinomonas sargassi TaxID=2984494 RepID=A0ABT2YSZ5_9GAMM|nr:TIGR04211 family SH3 domain-containing protein [Marinomonas sargassi]MCV2403000.1 TIGR04211 family SH3 domain-containing protein [Marinomonas sargassi]